MLRFSFYDCLLFCFYFTRLYAHKLIAVLLVEPALVSPVSVFPLFIIEENVGAFLQATSRVPRWWIGERPPDMAASCDIYK